MPESLNNKKANTFILLISYELNMHIIIIITS